MSLSFLYEISPQRQILQILRTILFRFWTFFYSYLIVIIGHFVSRDFEIWESLSICFILTFSNNLATVYIKFIE